MLDRVKTPRMRMVDEFKQFIARGNVVDLAVGVVIGTAFGKIVTSLVEDVIMPPIGWILGRIDFAGLKVMLGATQKGPVSINYGNFLQAMVNFFIIAAVIFLVVKAVNRFLRREAAKPSVPPAPTREEVLLAEIRDLLKTRAL